MTGVFANVWSTLSFCSTTKTETRLPGSFSSSAPPKMLSIVEHPESVRRLQPISATWIRRRLRMGSFSAVKLGERTRAAGKVRGRVRVAGEFRQQGGGAVALPGPRGQERDRLLGAIAPGAVLASDRPQAGNQRLG